MCVSEFVFSLLVSGGIISPEGGWWLTGIRNMLKNSMTYFELGETKEQKEQEDKSVEE